MGWKTYEVVMDIKNGVKSGQIIQIVTEDYGTNVLKVKLVQDSRVPYDLTGKNVKIMVKTPSGARIQQACTIENAVSGTILATLQQSLILEEGTYSAEFQIYEDGSSVIRLTTPNFRYFVRQSLQTDESVKADNNYTILQEMLNRAEALIELVSAINAQDTLDKIADLEIIYDELTLQLAKVKDYELLEQDFIDLKNRVEAFEDNMTTAIENAQTATSEAALAASNANSKATLANTATTNANAKITDVESRFNTLTTAKQGDSEVIDARKGKPSLKAKIDELESQSNENAANHTVLKGIVDGNIKMIKSGYVGAGTPIPITFAQGTYLAIGKGASKSASYFELIGVFSSALTRTSVITPTSVTLEYEGLNLIITPTEGFGFYAIIKLA